MLGTLTNLFPIWVLLGGSLALLHPPLFTWFRGPAIVWGLAVIMLGMGMTLSIDDFRRAFTMPRAVVIGFAAQYTVMPLAGYAVGVALGLPTPFAVGLILVACCPGGTASNVVTYIAGADVPLSVLMTMCSTMAAIVMTPVLTERLAGTLVPVDAWGLFLSTVQVVLLPVLTGIALHHTAPRLVRAVVPVAPLVAVVAIVMICSSVIGQSATAIRESGLSLAGAVFLLHATGFLVGYFVARLAGYEPVIARTISIEVGMQNSGLGVVLARQHFADPLTAAPAALSSVFHSVIGSALAAIWRSQRPDRSGAVAPAPTFTQSGRR